MQAKEYLLQIKRLDSLIKNKMFELDKLKSESVCKASSYGERVQTTFDPNSKEKMLTTILSLEKELSKDIEYYISVKNEIIKTIDELESSNEIDVLYKKYVQFKTWEQIAVEMNYTFRNVLIIHGKALKNLQKLIKIS